jgi:hypothetical protein
MSIRITAAALLAVAALATNELQAQERASVSVVGGVTEYDLSGVGDRRIMGLRAEIPISGPFIVQPGVSYMNYRDQFSDPVRGPRSHLWFPEVQLQAELPFRALRPYAGVGAGASLQFLDGNSNIDATLSVAAGLRVDLPAGFGIGGELRVRAVDPWAGSTADFALSVSRRL